MINKLKENIRGVLNMKDSKDKELKEQIESNQREIDHLEEKIESISFKALIEEDEDSLKKHKKAKNDLDKKIIMLETLKGKLKALETFKESNTMKDDALSLHKQIQEDIDSNCNKYSELQKQYCEQKKKLKNTHEEMENLYDKILKAPFDVVEFLDYIEPSKIGMTEEEFESNRDRAKSDWDRDRGLLLFKDSRKWSKEYRELKKQDI